MTGHEGGWSAIGKPGMGGQRLGFVHQNRLVSLKTWPVKKSNTVEQAKSSTIEHNGYKVTLSSTPFDPAKHKLKRDGLTVASIDGHEVWGKDGGVPDTELRIEVIWQGTPLALPKEA